MNVKSMAPRLAALALILSSLSLLPAPAAAGSALAFSGGTGSAGVSHATALNAYPLTLTLWVQTSQNDSTYRGLVSKANTTNGYAISLRNGHVAAAYSRSGTRYILNGTNAIDGGFIADGEWHHVAFVVDASGGSLYVDGALQVSQGWTGTPTACTPTVPLLLGRYSGATLVGNLDEVALWNVARTELQIQAGLCQTLTGSEANLVAYWRCDEGSGTTVGNNAASGTSYNGTLSGGSWTASAAPFAAPTATTLSASEVTRTTATLNANVDPSGLLTTVRFDYGLTTSYGSSSTSTEVSGASTPPALIATGLSGLVPGTPHHFRAVAVNTGGTSYGLDGTFTTLPSTNANLSALVLAPGSLSPTFSSNTFTYTGMVPDGTASVTVTPTSADGTGTIQVSLNGGAGVNVASGATSSALALSLGNNQISVRVTAQDGMTVKTYNIYISRQLYVTTLAATGVTTNTAQLNGAVMPGGYATWGWFEWGTNSSFGNTSAPVSVGAGQIVKWLTNNPTGLSPLQSYHYRAVASNALGVVRGAEQIFGVGRRIFLWGDFWSGSSLIPDGLTNVAALAGGYSFALALKTDSTVAFWGSLSNGMTAPPAGLTNVVAISSLASASHALALRRDGTVVAWGRSAEGQTNVPAGLSNVVAVSAGKNFSLALKTDGTVVAWGTNAPLATSVPPSLSNVVAIAGGGGHCLALRHDGTVVAWGVNEHGEGTVLVTLMNEAVAISASWWLSLAVRRNGTVEAWGWNTPGGTGVPAGLYDVVAIAAGDSSGSALRRDGSITNWGNNSQGQWGIPAGVSDAVGIARGGTFGLAMTTERAPVVQSQTNSAGLNRDQLVTLFASDLDNDPLVLRITTLPAAGTLYQCNAGSRGPAITSANTVVSDALNRVIFAPATNSSGAPYASFQFTATDGVLTSAPGTVTINVWPGFAPHAATQPAWSYTGSNATLRAMVLPNYYSTLAWFEWGTNLSYGNTSAPVNVGNNASMVVLTNALTGLSPQPVYHYRVVASNALGVALGADQFFGMGRSLAAWGRNNRGQTNFPSDLTNVVAISAGADHSLALKTDGTVSVWGYGAQGQTNLPAGLTNVVAVDGGGNNCLALRNDGSVVAWGSGYAYSSQVVPTLTNVVALAGGSAHAVALRENGTLTVWGLLDGTNVPPGLSNIVSIASGTYHTLALKSDSTVTAWGYNGSGQSSVPGGLTNVVAVSAGDSFSLARLRSGGVVLWGETNFGLANIPASLTNAVGLAGGGVHALALRGDGSVATWGDNYYGQTNPPAGLRNVLALAGGESHSLVMLSSPVEVYVPLTNAPFAATLPAKAVTGTSAFLNGMVTPNNRSTTAWFEWGLTTNYGNLTAPFNVGAGDKVIYVTNQISGLSPAWPYHFRLVASNDLGVTCGMDQMFGVGRQVLAWGRNGQTNVPAGLSNVTAISSGGYHTLALKTDGTVATWGETAPIVANIPSSATNIVAVASGGLANQSPPHFSLALRGDGQVIAWGDNDWGRTNVPANLSNVVAIAASGGGGLALQSDGRLMAWGNNQDGATNVPGGLSNVVSIAGGNDHYLALRDNGTVAAWGDNYAGQTVVPEGLSNVIAVAAGGAFSLAVKRDGSVIAWGDSTYGQTNPPAGLTNSAALTGGAWHALAIQRDGSVTGWGWNIVGETQAPVPALSALAVAAGESFSVCLVADLGPLVTNLAITGGADSDLVIPLRATDRDGDPVTLRIVSLPGVGSLYQFNNGSRGGAIFATNTTVSDTQGRVIFAPEAGGSGSPYTSFQFAAHDGFMSSTAATVTVSIVAGAAPLAHTLPATSVTGPTATLNSMASPNFHPTTIWFEWGTNLNYGNTTAPASAGAGGSVTLCQAPLSGLNPLLTYHCRVVASNRLGVAYGADRFFAVGYRLRPWGDNTYGQLNVPAGLSNVVAIAAGSRFNLALRSDGSVAAWGENLNGQTNVPAGLTGVAGLAAGQWHSLALKNDGRVVAWGSGLGTGPIPAWLSNACQVAAGYNHSAVLRSDGSLTLWGSGYYNQTNTPSDLSNVVEIAAGSHHTAALRNDGTVTAWGDNTYDQLLVPVACSNVVALAAQGQFTLALRRDGTVVAWGRNDWGQSTVPSGLSNIVAIAAGEAHSLGLKSDGTVRAWGVGTAGNTNVPVDLPPVLAVGAGTFHSLALTAHSVPVAASLTANGKPNSDLLITLSATDANGDPLSLKVISVPTNGALYQCNGGARGSLISAPDTLVSDPSNRVVFVPATNAFASPYASFQFMANNGFFDSAPATITINIIGLAPFANTEPAEGLTGTNAFLRGMVSPNQFLATAWFEWGTDKSYGHTTPPVSVGGGGAVKFLREAISGLSPRVTYHFRVVASNQVGVTHGPDEFFATGKSVWAFTSSGATDVPAGLGAGAVAVAAGFYHKLVLRGDGTVAAWDYSLYGETNVPPGLGNVVAVAAASFFSMALRSDGTVAVWGDPTYGATNVPAGLTNVIAIAARTTHCLALRSDGTVVAWGKNDYGQTNVPTNLANVVRIAAGERYSLALKDDGTLVGWGGDPYWVYRPPASLTNLIAIEAGQYHALARRRDGSVAVWGDPAFTNNMPASVDQAVALAAGFSHDFALKSNGTLVGWADPQFGQPTVPASLSNAVQVSVGYNFSLALADSVPPVCQTVETLGYTNRDLVLTLKAIDVNGDALAFRIRSLPTSGALYQYAGGNRGAAINAIDTPVLDAAGRVIFTPAPNTACVPYTSFRFIANDGWTDSANQAQAHVNIIVPPTTLPATSLTPGGATLNGVSPLFSTVYWVAFEYGPTTNYGQIIPSPTVPGTISSTASVAVAGLLPGRLYHCRLVASTTLGVFNGDDLTFTTRPPVPPSLRGPTLTYSGAMFFNATGTVSAGYQVWASTNLTNWSSLGVATEITPGNYEFIDSASTNHTQRFYQMRWNNSP